MQGGICRGKAGYNAGVKRVGRHILNGLTLLSLVLFALTIAACIAGRSQPIEVGWFSNGPEADGRWHTAQYGVVWGRGRMTVGRSAYAMVDDGDGATGGGGRGGAGGAESFAGTFAA